MITDALVTTDDIFNGEARLRKEGIGPAMDRLHQIEPTLYGHVLCASHGIAGQLALYEVPQHVVRSVADDVLQNLLVAIFALRECHHRLWQPPAELDEDIPF